MPTTPIFAFPYPSLTDAPNGAAQIQALAQAVETSLNSTNSNVTTLQTLFATGVAVTNTQNTLGTTTSLTYVETLTGASPAQLIFVAPASGKVLVVNAAFVDNTTTPRSYCSWIIRNGGTIGSGTTFLDGGDTKALSNVGVDDLSCSRTSLVTGLSPGSSYNIRQQFKVSSASTGQYQNRELAVLPVWV